MMIATLAAILVSLIPLVGSETSTAQTPLSSGADPGLGAELPLENHSQDAPIVEAEPPHRSVPAEFVARLALPGQADHFLRPSALFVDTSVDEVLVADSGHNRIVVLDTFGTYKYEFHGQGHFSTPCDLDVDSQGHIYVLGSTRSGKRVFQFDFDGLFLRELDAWTPEGPLDDIASIAIDEEDEVCVIDRARMRVCRFDRQGTYLGAFPLLGNMSHEDRREQVLGSVAVIRDMILLPIPSLGTVQVYDRRGDLIRSVGHPGNNVGELSFPVSVTVGENDLLMVLDKHRFNVVCFNFEGKFLGEFGGKGISPGWFYHPTLLATDKKNQVYVGQIFQNKIQVCRLPGFIAAANRSAAVSPDI